MDMGQKKYVYTALVTPFDERGELNRIELRRLLQFQINAGVEGILILGTTGESPCLAEEERNAIITIAREEIPSSVKLMVRTGSNSTRQAIHHTLQAKELGADEVLIVTPYYNKPTQEGIFLHFKTIAESCAIPIFVYNIQGRAAQNIQTETLLKIASLPHVKGVKESSGNLRQIMEVMENILPRHPDFLVLSGDDDLTLPVMALGGHGVISVVSNLIPEEISELVKLAANGRFSEAKELFFRILPLIRLAFIETNPIPIKFLLNSSGFNVGGCRLPLCSLTEQNSKLLHNFLAKHPIKLLEETPAGRA